MESPGITISASASTVPKTPSWTATTNWTIARGSLANSVTVESSLSLLDDVVVDSNSSVDNSSTALPLVLYPPALDFSPCAITITFQQRHEVRQVYLCSTARVYEMYYTKDCQSDNEYLGTVRCGIATRDGQVLHATGVEEAVLACQSCSRNESDEGELGNNSSLTTNEDEWVEVKAFGASQPGRRNVSDFESSDAGSKRSLELHEATAEIADASPCMSFMLKLLSLKNKGCVCIDEVYVFADLVDECNVDNQVDPGANSAGNSLMAMLVPAFLQMSKMKVGEDKCNKIASPKQNTVEIGSKAMDPTNFPTKVQQGINSGSADKQEVKLQDAAGSSVVPVQLGTSQEVPDFEGNYGKLSCCTDIFLDRLFSRVNRIEDLLLGFQEKLLKPINSIDERLQRVEQQLDILTRNSQNSGFVSCTRISAPEFSCGESESSSFYHSGCVDPVYVACETNKDLPAISDSSDTTIVSVNASAIHPSVAVSAPEFSNCDDDDEKYVAETVKEYPGDKQKRAMSINDALESALAGFLTSTSGQSQTYLPMLAVKAPDFPTEEETKNEKSASLRIRINPARHDGDPSIFSSELEATDRMESFFSNAAPNSSLSGNKNVEKYSGDDNMVKGCSIAFQSQQTLDQVDSQCLYDGHEVASHGEFEITGNLVDDTESPEASDDILKIFSFEKTGCLVEICENQTDDSADATQERVVDESASAEVSEGGAQKDILSDIMQFVRIASIPDYANAPILEVEFLTEENQKMESPLEALLSSTLELTIQVPCEEIISKDDTLIANDEGSNLILMEDWGTEGCTSSSSLITSVDMDYYSLTDVPKDVEADNLHGNYECCSKQEMSAGSLI